MIKDIEKQDDHDPKNTQKLQKRVDEWTKNLQDLPDSELIMRENNLSIGWLKKLNYSYRVVV